MYYFANLYLSWCGVLRLLHSFPTRRSSDLPRCDGLLVTSWVACYGGGLAGRGGGGWMMRASVVAVLAGSVVGLAAHAADRKSTRLNSSHPSISYAVFCLKKKKIDSTLFTTI